MSSMRVWSMKSIYLEQIYLIDQMALDLISACPNLEILELGNCNGMDTLTVCSVKLKKLELKYFNRKETEVNLEIDCPNLISSSIIWFEAGKFCFKNLSSLVQFRTSDGYKRDECCGYWNKVVRTLDKVPHIRSLAVHKLVFCCTISNI
ncbi:uncharacterized protein LOC110617467 [Manihot esculenta]|uniref:uncharacterized protein LOC110617467 n=1 Tax=Manihot esculenta TaxID=3983 RepID=UPI000B5D187A|nr:uncharacterized protein LOC110617467 [Manihot esculenta]